MQDLWQDVRYGARRLARSPGFAAAAIVSLGLGIGANTTIFTLINSVFLNPLPVEKPWELVAVFTVDENNRGLFSNMNPVSRPNYEDYRDQNEVFSGLASYSFPFPVSLSSGAGEPEQAFTELVTGNYFDLLGVKPAEGRFFLPDEDRAPGLNPVMVLSHGLWQRRFGMDPKVVGRELTVNGRAFTVVGVAPRRFKGVNAIAGPDFWVPMMMYAQVLPRQLSEMFQERRALFFNVAGRLKPGAELGQAESNLKTIARRLEQEYPEPNKGRTAALLPLTEATIFPGIRQLLVRGGVILMTVVVLVLLIACSNVANLLLARAAARRKEVAIRLSIGASRRRLVRQLLVESLLLSLAAGGFGLLVAFWGRDLIWSIRPPFLAQNTLDLTLDSRVLLFTLFVSLATGLVFGLVPALQASRPAMVDELKEGVRAGFGRSQRRISLKNTLVIAQVALSLVALVAAGLFLRSLEGAQAIDPGFETENLAVLTVNPGQRGYEPARGEQFYQELVERLRSLAGVRSVSLAVNLPLFGGFQRSVFLEDQPQEAGKGVLVLTNAVGLDYFGTTGISLVRGRDFTQSDREGTLRVAIVNEAMSRRFWPDQDPVGKRFRFYGDDFFHEVVGVARTAKYVTLGEDPQPCAYLPLAQNYSDGVTVYLRSESDPAAALGAARREVRAIDPEMPVTNSWTIGELMGQSLWASKLGAALLSALGLLALVLAAVGIYGVMAQWVAERYQEVGIRLALGARRADVIRMILSESMSLVGVGVAFGLLVSFAISRAASNLLYGISPTDPLTYAGVAALLAGVALVSSWLPAHRAGQVDPLTALRYP